MTLLDGPQPRLLTPPPWDGCGPSSGAHGPRADGIQSGPPAPLDFLLAHIGSLKAALVRARREARAQRKRAEHWKRRALHEQRIRAEHRCQPWQARWGETNRGRFR